MRRPVVLLPKWFLAIGLMMNAKKGYSRVVMRKAPFCTKEVAARQGIWGAESGANDLLTVDSGGRLRVRSYLPLWLFVGFPQDCRFFYLIWEDQSTRHTVSIELLRQKPRKASGAIFQGDTHVDSL